MPAPKKTPQDHRGKVAGKVFTWTTEDGDTIDIPLRIKVKVLRSMSSKDLDVDGMFAMLEALIPGQAEAIDELDVNDLTNMFTAWQSAYNAQTGATLGESSASSA